jgi:hypothetical protein
MDEITNKRFDLVEERIEGVRAELKGEITQVKTEVSGKLDNVARGLESSMNAAITSGFQAAAQQQRQFHAETMQKFQRVIDEAERVGAMAARDRRVSELEAEVIDLRERLAKIESALGARRGQ